MAGPLKILVVEDDKSAHREIREKIGREEIELCFACNGLDGLKLFEETRPDLCLFDVLLPKMNGFDLCAAVKKHERGKEVPVFLMSAVYKNLAVQNEAKEKYGADEFFTKPLDYEFLVRKIEGAVPELAAHGGPPE